MSDSFTSSTASPDEEMTLSSLSINSEQQISSTEDHIPRTKISDKDGNGARRSTRSVQRPERKTTMKLRAGVSNAKIGKQIPFQKPNTFKTPPGLRDGSAPKQPKPLLSNDPQIMKKLMKAMVVDERNENSILNDVSSNKEGGLVAMRQTLSKTMEEKDEEIKSLNETVSYQEDLISLYDDMNAAQQDADSRRADLQAVNDAEKKNLERDLLQANDNFSRLSIQTQKLGDKIKSQAITINQLKGSQTTANADALGKENEIIRLSGLLTNTNNALQTTSMNLSAKVNDINQLNEELRVVKGSLSSAMSDVLFKENQIARLKADVKAVKNALTGANSALLSAQSENEKMKSSHKEEIQKMKNINQKESQKFQAKINVLAASSETTEKKLLDSKINLERIVHERDVKSKESRSLRSMLTDAQNQISMLSYTNTTLMKENQWIKQTLNGDNPEVFENARRVVDLQYEITQVVRAYGNVALAVQSEANAVYSQQAAEFEARLVERINQELQQTLYEKDMQCKRLIEESTQRFEDAKVKLGETECARRMKVAENSYEQCEKSFKSLKEKTDGEIARLTKEISNGKQDFVKGRRALDENNYLKQTLFWHQKDLAELDDQTDSLRSENATLKKANEALERRFVNALEDLERSSTQQLVQQNKLSKSSAINSKTEKLNIRLQRKVEILSSQVSALETLNRVAEGDALQAKEELRRVKDRTCEEAGISESSSRYRVDHRGRKVIVRTKSASPKPGFFTTALTIQNAPMLPDNASQQLEVSDLNGEIDMRKSTELKFPQVIRHTHLQQSSTFSRWIPTVLAGFLVSTQIIYCYLATGSTKKSAV